jgi:TfoX/Sxy family transcriptional regulator of competence genes
MQWKKSPPDLIEAFTKAASAIPVAEQKKMFGYPSIFVNGYLTAGLFQDGIMFRLSEYERAAFLKLPGTGPFEPMPGRPMGGYMFAPGSLVKDGRQLRKWLEKAVAASEALPPKKKAAPRKKAVKKAARKA